MWKGNCQGENLLMRFEADGQERKRGYDARAIGAVTGNGRIAEEPVDHSHVAAQPGACASRKNRMLREGRVEPKDQMGLSIKVIPG